MEKSKRLTDKDIDLLETWKKSRSNLASIEQWMNMARLRPSNIDYF